MLQTVEIIVKGRVQGVGFRYFTSTAAQQFGIHGWVRNEPDGSVRMQVAGAADALDNFRNQIKKGPAFGRVDHCDETPLDGPEAPVFDHFEIRR